MPHYSTVPAYRSCRCTWGGMLVFIDLLQVMVVNACKRMNVRLPYALWPHSGIAVYRSKGKYPLPCSEKSEPANQACSCASLDLGCMSPQAYWALNQQSASNTSTFPLSQPHGFPSPPFTFTPACG
ncbi:hypothetical protein NA56DRAFT_712429 [Hyaloscypha hepaticicola]|uniref:Uncharacterized protein n=1 Tax=Hyaloscypha hepaticicola TaxID=2082293 RepID=A0A2J6PGD1_9HELO|nr:hypothetical protein NA56DRAFT_712429 [Hyaloscypha hepaticicola]